MLRKARVNNSTTSRPEAARKELLLMRHVTMLRLRGLVLSKVTRVVCSEALSAAYAGSIDEEKCSTSCVWNI